jgi:multiple sugar transport system permease protein
LLRPFTGLVVVSGFIGAFQIFTLVFVLTQGGPLPAHSTEVLAYRIYQNAWELQGGGVGVATALACVLLVLMLVFRWPQLKLLARVLRHA